MIKSKKVDYKVKKDKDLLMLCLNKRSLKLRFNTSRAEGFIKKKGILKK